MHIFNVRYTMKIEFNNERHIFSLKTESLAYYFSITEKGILKHLYFGSYIEDIDEILVSDLGFEWSKTYLDKNELIEKEYSNNFYYDKSFVELGTHGLSDPRPSSFIIDVNGNNKVDFRYISHRIYKGKPILKELPHFKANEKESLTLEITLKDIVKNIYLELSYTLVDGIDCILRNTKIINKEKECKIEKAMSLTLDLPTSKFNLMSFPGDWSNERNINNEKISFGMKRISSKFGRSGHEQNPFLILEKSEDLIGFSSEYIGISFVYSGNFVEEINVDKYATTRINIGINDEDFSYSLEVNEEFELPEAILVYSSSLNGLTQNFHNIIRSHLIDKTHRELQNKILLNSWEACYMDFDTEKVKKYINEAKKLNVGLFVLDDGWFGKRNNDTCSLGDWYINESKVNLDEIIKECHKNDIKFGIWYEPEMINPDSDLFRNHKDFIVGDINNYELALSRHQLVLDFSNPNVVDYIFKSMCSLLDKYKVDYIKWDHNRSIFDAYSSYLGYEKSGKFFHDNIKGVYSLLSKLKNRYPHILFEGCASGGGRFDLGMLYYTPQIWTSDETDPVQRMFIQYSTSLIYPLITMGSHISKNPITSYLTKGNVALFGTFGYEFDPLKINEEERKEVIISSENFEKYHNLIVDGDLYHLYSPFATNFMCMEVVSKDKKEAIVLFTNLIKERNVYRTLKLQGLDDNKLYRNNYNNMVLKGYLYKNIGINLTRWFDEFTSLLIYLVEVNE